ncbi:MAG: hypothetical protein KC684_06060 [Candidatus Omnitrophica bacterium]|nr:hypothetical protein [Candidatus Omnitrophota bacterium]
MTQEEKKELLRDRRVVEEIGRHQWIESEKLGYDIGFEQAAEDWLERFSKAWMRYHMPKKAKDASSKKSKPSSKPAKS